MMPRKTAVSLALVSLCLLASGLLRFGLQDVSVDSTGRAVAEERDAGKQPKGLAKRAPYAAIRWNKSAPEVKLDEQWFRLVSLNDIPVSEIVTFSREAGGRQWRKRFEEDLVELLSRMGHPPGDTVKLVVQSLDSSKMFVRDSVPMTKANRWAIWEAAQERDAMKEPQQHREKLPFSAVPIDDRQQYRRRADEFLQLIQKEAGFSGVVVVAQAGDVVYQGACGYSHLEPKIPNSAETPFRIASLSKQFTAAAILFLEQQGTLSLDDPVHRYLPELASAPYKEITIAQLLTHTSGLPRKPEEASRNARWSAMATRATSVDEYVRLASECPLKYEPGQQYLYSNFGYRLLSAVIVRTTGQSYPDFMAQNLFDPLGLKHSGVARITQPRTESRVADGLRPVEYDADAKQPIFEVLEQDRNYGAGYGSGGIFTSANDLVRWDRVLAGDDFLSTEQKGKLFRPVKNDYACGWKVKDVGGRLCQTHSGANEGYFSQMLRIPEDDLVIIALGNVPATDDIDEAVEQLVRLCLSMPYEY